MKKSSPSRPFSKMTLKKVISSFLLILLLGFLVACGGPDDGPGQTDPEPEEDLSGQEEEGQGEKGGDTAPEPVLVEDASLYEALWQNLLYDAITTVGNSDGFKRADALDPGYMASFLYTKCRQSESCQKVDYSEKEGRGYIKKADLLSLGQDYFYQLSSLAPMENDSSYDKEKEEFFYYYHVREDLPGYEEGNAFDIRFEKLYQVDEETYRAHLVSRTGPDDQYIQTLWAYDLHRTEEGDWLFISLEKSHPDNQLVQIEGDYKETEFLLDEEANMDAAHWQFLGEAQGRAFFWTSLYKGQEDQHLLVAFDPDKMSLSDQVHLEGRVEGVSFRAEGILVKTASQLLSYDWQLALVDESPLPQLIADYYPDPGQEGQAEETDYYAGYDLSPDGRFFCFADEQGLYLFDGEKGEKKLIQKTLVFGDDPHFDRSNFGSLRFVNGGKEILASLSGYESILDYALISLEPPHDLSRLSMGDQPLVVLQGDRGLLSLGQEARWLSFTDRKTKTFSLSQPLDFDVPHGRFRPGSWPFAPTSRAAREGR